MSGERDTTGTRGALPPSAEAEWERFARHLDLIANDSGEDGFWLAFLAVHSPAVARVVKGRVQARFDARSRAFVELPAETPARLQNVLPRLLGEETARVGCVWVEAPFRDTGSEPGSPWREAWSQLLLGMNERRDAIRRHLPGGLVLVGPLALKEWAQAAAPDLWSVRTLVLELPEEMPGADERSPEGPAAAFSAGMEDSETGAALNGSPLRDARAAVVDAANHRRSFARRLERVLRLREPDAIIEEREPPAPFDALFMATRRAGRIVDVAVVGGLEGPVTEPVVEAFLRAIRQPLSKESPLLRCTLIHTGDTASEELFREARAAHVVLQSFSEYQSIVDFSRYLAWQTERLDRDPIYPPELYVEQSAEVRIGPDRERTEDALSTLHALLLEPKRRFVLVLGDFGTGKTFLLRQLARRMAGDPASPPPVLVEMRDLQKSLSLDMLLAQHFVRPPGGRVPVDAFRYLLSEGKAALLFDGFDELAFRLSYDGVREHFATVLEAAEGNAKVVVTSRTAHFLNDRDVELSLGREALRVPGYRRLMLEPFDRSRIHKVLVKRLGTEEEAREREELLEGVEDLVGLSANPRMLAFILDCFTPEELREAKATGGKLTRSGVYERLVTRWLQGEARRATPRGADAPLSEGQLWKAVTDFALLLWPRREKGLRMRDVPQSLWASLAALDPTRTVDTEEAKVTVGSRSLLVRDDDGQFSFLHHSIMEWLVARNAAKELEETGTAVMLARKAMSSLMAEFFVEMAGPRKATKWARKAIADGGEGAKNGALLLRKVGHVADAGMSQVHLDLSGRDLSRQDFSGTDYLRGANLSRAILTHATLVGADLTGANLAGASLGRADLRGASLVGCDLTNASLERADLRKTKLNGAKLDRVNANYARLLGAALSAGSLEKTASKHGAAMPRNIQAVPVADTYSLRTWREPTITRDGRLILVSYGDGPTGAWHIPECRFTGSGSFWQLEESASDHGRRAREGDPPATAGGGVFEAAPSHNTVTISRAHAGEARTIQIRFPLEVSSVEFHPTRPLLMVNVGGVISLCDVRGVLGTTASIQHLATLVHGPDGWAAFAPDGRYKVHGDVKHVFSHVVGGCRFEAGELDDDLDAFDIPPRRVPMDEPLFEMPEAL